MKISLTDIFNLNNSIIYNPDKFKSVSKISTDSRTIKANSLYVALKGNKYDGHNFIKEAILKGASAVMINKNRLKNFSNLDCTVITVPNTTLAYGELAAIFRSKFKGIVISITGSNGKTTTKEILATLLNEKFKTEKTLANDNNHIGIPKTILSTKNSTEVLVLEHGTNHFGEIEYTANIAQPDYAIITNIGDSHLEYLIDRNGVYKEKSTLLNAAINNGGKIFANTDDPLIKSQTKNIKKRITFGFNGKPNIMGKIIGYTPEGKTKLVVEYLNSKIEIDLPIYGSSSAKNVLISVGVALHLGLTPSQILAGISKISQVKGRLFVKPFSNATLIDDTYNSNPASMMAAIDLLKRIKTYSTKTLVIGDMFELGENAELIHKELSKIILKSKIKNVFTIGKLMKNLSLELEKEKINSKYFSTRKLLTSFIKQYDFNNQVVLVKGSRGMKMEDFAEQIREKIN
ncbi:MAG: UDP-N-acetylmuramoyl-tripeptide--D-alanyl-D-alanine ligase [Bacteroidetes bacterium]|nr:UDP-N-acetylmuramoyl-tripeptide--D-alanyl-D-alanine ligase [Bacteroidota bacterium]MBU1116558.1 UDP-N-acetylmuramoyl-tripeptide--D-alanyl-D-alanine ligase [Bacteroidota bacterium]MBU1797552.1 UDP-N-acetylmuramoyl-tripeptide--D-alanyl-D-alanine ligase [Bacteroidota bacterium]